MWDETNKRFLAAEAGDSVGRTLLEFSWTMPVKRVLDPETFDAVLSAHLEEATGATYVVFIGSEDPGTGESWCSDCVISDPIIRGNVPQGATLVECPVGDRAVYKVCVCVVCVRGGEG